MRYGVRVSRILCALAVVSFAVAAAPFRLHAADELEKHLRDQYDNRTLILRGFYRGERLRYDSAGMPVGTAVPGDSTVSGFVRVTSVSLSDQRLTIQAGRLTLINDGRTFGFQVSGGKKKDEKAKSTSRLRIEVELDPGGVTAERAEALLSRIFLTAQDRLAGVVPGYWMPCALAASTSKGRKQYTACRFPPEFAAIPGVVSSPNENPESGQVGDGEAKTSDSPVARIGKNITPPRPIFSPDPDFSEQARQAHYQGTIVLLIVVDTTGEVRNIRILKPLGFGLDQKAVEAVAKWRFKPAEKDGQPVEKELAIEVDFHLYN
jgi:TonB family protein